MDYKELLEKAKEASKNTYSPYSNFPVGACLVTPSGKTFVGTNVENASFGATICAERSAIMNMVVNGEREIETIAIYGPKMKMCAPCGICRQVIAEFKLKNGTTHIVLEGEDGKPKAFTLEEILPLGFEL